jgi:hypothetical protein
MQFLSVELIETKDVIECAVQSHLSTIADGLGVVTMDMSSFGLQYLAENSIYDAPLPSQCAQMNWCNESNFYIFDRPLNDSVHLISTRIYTSTHFFTHSTLSFVFQRMGSWRERRDDWY